MSNKLLTEEQRELYSLMLPTYGAVVRQSKMTKILNVSLASLWRMRKQGIGPAYKIRWIVSAKMEQLLIHFKR